MDSRIQLLLRWWAPCCFLARGSDSGIRKASGCTDRWRCTRWPACWAHACDSGAACPCSRAPLQGLRRLENMPCGSPQSTWPWHCPLRWPGCGGRHNLQGQAVRQGACCRRGGGRELWGDRACRGAAWESKTAFSLPLSCILSFYCLFSQSSVQARSPKVISATRAITVSRQAPISSGATVLRLPIVQTRASASPRAAEKTTFLLAMPKDPMKYPTNVPGASSVQTRVPVVKPFLLSAVSANWTAMVPSLALSLSTFICSLDLPDQCEAPPNFRELADTTGRGLNANGSVCLNNICMWANATLQNPCVVENTAYIAYEVGGEYINIVSRGNCAPGLYCDSVQKVCLNEKSLGESCDGDKECVSRFSMASLLTWFRCQSWNCQEDGTCGKAAAEPRHVGVYAYILVALGIFGGKLSCAVTATYWIRLESGMFGTLIGLFCFHRKQRDSEREKRMQYWKEQVCEQIVLYNHWSHSGTTRMLSTRTSKTCARLPDYLSFLSTTRGVPGAQCTAVRTCNLFCQAVYRKRLDCVITWPATTALTMTRAQW